MRWGRGGTQPGEPVLDADDHGLDDRGEPPQHGRADAGGESIVEVVAHAREGGLLSRTRVSPEVGAAV